MISTFEICAYLRKTHTQLDRKSYLNCIPRELNLMTACLLKRLQGCIIQEGVKGGNEDSEEIQQIF